MRVSIGPSTALTSAAVIAVMLFAGGSVAQNIRRPPAVNASKDQTNQGVIFDEGTTLEGKKFIDLDVHPCEKGTPHVRFTQPFTSPIPVPDETCGDGSKITHRVQITQE
jgi:hypothetical protein